MYIIFIDSVVFAVIIFLGMSAGAGATDVLVNIVKDHQQFLIIFMALTVIGINIAVFIEVENILRRIIYIIINVVLDCFIHFGVVVAIFTELECISSGFDNNFIGMIFLFIPALLELFLIVCIAIGGGYCIPYLINCLIAAIDNGGGSGIIALFVNLLLKILYGMIFLCICYSFIHHYPNSYNNIFQNTVYDSVMKIVGLWNEKIIHLLANFGNHILN